MKGRRLVAVVERICGPPVRQRGSHRRFVSPVTGRAFSFAVHDRDEVPGGLVRRILVEEIGLDEQRARKELR